MTTPQNPPRVSGYTASARTLTRSSLPGPSAMEIRKCVHRVHHQYHQYHHLQHHHHHHHHRHHGRQQYRHQQYRHYLSNGYDDCEEEDERDERFRRYPQLSLRGAPGTLSFVNLLVKRRTLRSLRRGGSSFPRCPRSSEELIATEGLVRRFADIEDDDGYDDDDDDSDDDNNDDGIDNDDDGADNG
ncbi:hypothetical protein KM043_007534 [Ampulex compressa]|nr:hypothetical protein KM043_007534 [Ampulex compressa]